MGMSIVVGSASPVLASASTPLPAPMPSAAATFETGAVHRIATDKRLPSCRAYKVTGRAGRISVQTTKSGYVSWGIYAPKYKAAVWVVSVLVNGKKVDGKNQPYEPHGSLPPSKAPAGSTFSLRATATNPRGDVAVNVPNRCRVP